MSSAHLSGNSRAWPGDGVTRTPYWVFQDPELYEAEQRRIFQGPTWNFLALEIELPEPGSFRTISIGTTPVIVVRDAEGGVRAFVNRCAHKGALLCPEAYGKVNNFTCLYHAWNYTLKGDLRSVPFRQGVDGKGGMPPEFDMKQHGLQKLRVETTHGIVFGTFSDETPPLEEYLGAGMMANIRRLFSRPIELLGYHHQKMNNNWKLYAENVRDPYHATILHAFFTTFRLNTLTMDGGIEVSDTGHHHISYSKAQTSREGGYEGQRALMKDVGLADPSVLDRRLEHADGTTLAIQSIFPNFVVQQIHNSLAVRWFTPLGLGESELHWAFFGYKDDDDEMKMIRRKQSNLAGPAGFISMEDGVIGDYVQRGISGSEEGMTSIMELGGRDVASSQSGRATETSVRGFWRGYRHFMGL